MRLCRMPPHHRSPLRTPGSLPCWVFLLLAGVLSLSPARSAAAATYEVVVGSKENLIVFESHAPMESFEGKSHKVTGFVELELSSLVDSVTIEIRADLASFDTGIGMRNKHMRENHLETDKYPVAVFRGGRVLESSMSSLTPGEPATMTLRGSMELHGVTRELVVPMTATLESDHRLRIHTQFDIALPDYEIKRPKFLLLKLNEVQNVTVDLLLVPAGGAGASTDDRQ